MGNLPEPVVTTERHFYEKLASSPLFKITLYFVGALLLFILLLLVYLKLIYGGTLLSFLSEKLPRNSVLTRVIPEEKLFSYTIEEIGGGNYFLKLGGKFVSAKEDEGNAHFAYLTLDTYLKGRVEVKYNKDYSRTYWKKVSFESNKARFSQAKYFPDPTDEYPDWYVVGNGYTYLTDGDLVEVDFVISEDVKEQLGTKKDNLTDQLKGIPVYFLFVKTI